ncbi:MAG: YdbH domain-containing protein [Deltaproteobacteria bacterium]|nr:YdbH domain-containing protein [Deltaproteobacteria bacterium]
MNKRSILVGLCLFLIAGFTLLYFCSPRIATLIFQSAIHDASALGLEVTVHKFSLRQATVSFRGPDGKIIAENIDFHFSPKLTPLGIQIRCHHQVQGLSISSVTVQALEVEFSYYYRLIGSPVIELQTTGNIFSNKTHVTVRGTLEDDLRFLGDVTFKQKGLELSGPFEVSHREQETTFKSNIVARMPPFFVATPLDIALVHSRAGLDATIGCGSPLTNCLVLPIASVSFNVGRMSLRLRGTKDLTFAVDVRDLVPNLPKSLSSTVHLDNLEGTVSGELSFRDFATRWKAHFRDRAKLLSISAEGDYHGTRGNGTAYFSIPVRFLGAVQPSQWLPMLKKRTSDIQGMLTLSGKAHFGKNKLQLLTLTTKAETIAGLVEKTPFQGFSINSHLTLFPSLRGTGEIRLRKLGRHATLDGFRVSFEIIGDSAKLLHFSGRLFGGEVSSQPFPITFSPLSFSTVLHVNELDLSALLKALDFDKLSGQGKMDGELPLQIDNDGLFVTKAVFKNRGNGIIRYDYEPGASKKTIEYLDEFQNLLQQGERALVMKALENFYYTLLTLDANRTPQSGVQISLHFKGSNPELARGQVFDIKLPITGQLEPFLKETLLKSFMEKEAWEEKAQDIMRHRP